MSKTLQGHHTKLNETKNNKKKPQKRRQSVVVGRQQLYCAVQSPSPNHCQTTTEKVQSSAHDGTSSVTVHCVQNVHLILTDLRQNLNEFMVWYSRV